MQGINRPTELLSATIYLAPANRPIKPVEIAGGTEIIEVLIGGRVYFEQNNEIKEFERGTIFWHVAGEYTIFRTSSSDPYRCLAIRLRVPEDRRSVPRVTGWSDDASLDAFADEAVRRFHDETIDRTYLCEYVHRRLFWESYIYNRRSVANAFPLPLSRALSMLRDAAVLNFSVQDMARHAGVSEPYLYALFHKHLGVSPHQYLLNRRLRLARIRLTGTDDNIKIIAEECGFENIESFYRAFRRVSGMPPGEYRRRQQFNN
ncbi:MAG: AraC family transcriptional regulator [Victivallales bacterium]|jgi:AraC-like DNA-binding protein|nr:AraC family transcriptional regulator [Victivallales bacterium]